MHLKASKPRNPAYPKSLNTIGDHIRKRRLDLGFFQYQVAEQIGVDECSIYNWESNATSPALRWMPAVFQFLGYNPLPKGDSVADQLVAWRTECGISRLAAAKLIGVDEGTLARWERGERAPKARHINLIDCVVTRNPA